MIPTAINISDTEFDKQVDKLPADKATLLIYYCGGLECVLSDNSAEKARKLGYTNVLTYPPGYPEWEKLHGAPAPMAAMAGAARHGQSGMAQAGAAGAGQGKGLGHGRFLPGLEANPGSIMLVDVRDPKEVASGMIKGSVNIPMNELEKKIGTLPTDKPVVFVCGTGARSGEAYDTVKLLGGKVQASFLDADVKFNADGSFSMVPRSKHDEFQRLYTGRSGR
jgi:rhodanese-related sulfurtransferase